MKYINCFFLLAASIATTSLSAQQLNNGREIQSKPQTAVNKAADNRAVDVFKGSDEDVPGQHKVEQQRDAFYPTDLEIVQEELNISSTSREVADRVNQLSAQVTALIAANEELRHENEIIRKSLSNCCTTADAALSAQDAYLLQNVPNPLQDVASIRYFIPENVNADSRIEITDLKGVLLQSYDLEAKGMNNLQLETSQLRAGNYVYTLYVDGKLIDSRVMVVAQ